MSEDEAEAIAAIMMTADSDCAWCAASLLKQFYKLHPEMEQAIDRAWCKEYDSMTWTKMGH